MDHPPPKEIEASLATVVSSVEAGEIARHHGLAELLRLQKTATHDVHSDAWSRILSLFHRFNASAPVNLLPAEILCLIFVALKDSPVANTPVRVCRHWRTVALSEPRLWSTIDLGSLTLLPVLFERASGADIDLAFWIPPRQRHGSDLYSHLLKHPEARVVSLSLKGPCDPRTLWPPNPDHSDITLPFLRQLNVNVFLRPGTWLCNITFMSLEYLVPVNTLATILSFTHDLKTLRIHSAIEEMKDLVNEPPPYDGPPPKVPTDELVFRPFTGVPPRWLCYIQALPHILRVVTAITSIDRQHLAAWRLSENLGPISALGLFHAANDVCVAFTDTEKRARQLCVKHSQLMDALKILFGADLKPLRDLERLTLSYTLLQHEVLTELKRATGLSSLGTVVIQLTAWTVPGSRLQAPRNILPFAPPSLREIALVWLPRDGSDPPIRATLDSMLGFARGMIEKPVRLPLLRLVNARLKEKAPLSPELKEDAQYSVERIEEYSWDHDDNMNMWITIPTYFVRW